MKSEYYFMLMLKIKTGESVPMADEKLSMTFPYKTDHFQNHSFNAIESGDHVLVTAHTGSGKTTVAEYSVAYGIKKGKKVIYTAPIKALSNQIFGDFNKKYPQWDIGIRTGDIDYKSETAQVIIMTTEILRNMLVKSDNVDALKDIGIVIFDEVHWIKDKDRGTVWEESIINMPGWIQMIMLSATLPDAEDFAQWIAQCKGRDVTFTSTPSRVVPLSHYVMTENKRYLIMDNDGNFNNENYLRAYREYTFSSYQINDYIKRMELPALFFCFSKKKCRTYANSIILNLVDSKTSSLIENEFNAMLLKFDKSYQYMKQTDEVKRLARLGIGYHHAGLLPPLKEIVQELFSKAYLQVLFVTETFAAGVNMPAKTVVFTGFSKISDTSDGKATFRTLLPEEYGQMSGRAGRRGIDKKGTVIHLPFNPKYDLLDIAGVKGMMCGRISKIKSRFKIDYSYFLRYVMGCHENVINKSLMALQDNNQYRGYVNDLKDVLANYELLCEELDGAEGAMVVDMYEQDDLYKEGKLTKKEKKHYYSVVKPWISDNIDEFNEYSWLLKEKHDYGTQLDQLNEMIEFHPHCYNVQLKAIATFLHEIGYLTELLEPEEYTISNITVNGLMASEVNECHPVILTELVNHVIDLSEPAELFAILAMLLGSSSNSEESQNIPDFLKSNIRSFAARVDELEMVEEKHSDALSDWSLSMHMCHPAYLWTKGGRYVDVIAETGLDIYGGEFVRTMLKLNNICKETLKIAKICKNDKIIKLLDNHQHYIVRDIVTPQSLYVQTK